MSRRIYYWNPKRKQIQQEALVNLRTARAHIGADLLDSARAAIAESMDQAASLPADAMIPVDRQKNLNTIMQFLELNRDNQVLLGKVRTMLSGPEPG